MKDHLDMPTEKNAEKNDWGVLDHWVEESGRRKHSAEWVASLYANAEGPPADADATLNRYIRQPILLSLFAMAALSYGAYRFIEVELAIASLQRLIVFVALK